MIALNQNAPSVTSGLLSIKEAFDLMRARSGDEAAISLVVQFARTALQVEEYTVASCLLEHALSMAAASAQDATGLEMVKEIIRRLCQYEGEAALAQSLKQCAAKALELEHWQMAELLLSSLADITSAPEHAWAQEQMATRCATDACRLAAAERECRLAIQHTPPTDPESLFGRLKLLEKIVIARHGKASQEHQRVQQRLVACAERLDADRLAEALSNVADIHHDAGQWPEAARLYQRVLDLHYRVHGEEHRPSGPVLRNLAGCLVQMGNEEAEKKVDTYETCLRRAPFHACRPDEYLPKFPENDAIVCRALGKSCDG